MWEAFVEGIGWETKTLPTLAEAQIWVRARVKEKFKLDITQFTAGKPTTLGSSDATDRD
jgi:hypothetical protein